MGACQRSNGGLVGMSGRSLRTLSLSSTGSPVPPPWALARGTSLCCRVLVGAACDCHREGRYISLCIYIYIKLVRKGSRRHQCALQATNFLEPRPFQGRFAAKVITNAPDLLLGYASDMILALGFSMSTAGRSFLSSNNSFSYADTVRFGTRNGFPKGRISPGPM